jgi:hypothetical protein
MGPKEGLSIMTKHRHRREDADTRRHKRARPDRAPAGELEPIRQLTCHASERHHRDGGRVRANERPIRALLLVERLLDEASRSAGLDATKVDCLRSAFEDFRVSVRTSTVSKERLMAAVCALLASKTN